MSHKQRTQGCMAVKDLFRRLLDKALNKRVIGDDYLIRYRLLSVANLNVYLHHFVGDDWARAVHDHPWPFVSIGLSGSYMEQYLDDAGWYRHRVYRSPWLRVLPARHRHRIIQPSRRCWTLIITGRRERSWFFYPDGVAVPWREYIAEREMVG